MVVAMDAMAVAIHIKYALSLNCHFTHSTGASAGFRTRVIVNASPYLLPGTPPRHPTYEMYRQILSKGKASKRLVQSQNIKKSTYSHSQSYST